MDEDKGNKLFQNIADVSTFQVEDGLWIGFVSHACLVKVGQGLYLCAMGRSPKC